MALSAGTNQVFIELSTRHLAAGRYVVSVDLTDPFIEYYDRVEDCVWLEIDPHAEIGESKLEQSWGYGSLSMPLGLKGLTLN